MNSSEQNKVIEAKNAIIFFANQLGRQDIYSEIFLETLFNYIAKGKNELQSIRGKGFGSSKTPR